MVDSLVPELELYAWEGQLNDPELNGSTNGLTPCGDEKRPRLIAAAVEPLQPNGTTRRRRFFLVEPLGMWVRDGQTLPENASFMAPASSGSPSASALSAAMEHIPDGTPITCPSPRQGPAVVLEPRSLAYSNGGQTWLSAGPQPVGLPVSDLYMQPEQQTTLKYQVHNHHHHHHRHHHHQQQQQQHQPGHREQQPLLQELSSADPSEGLTGFQGPLRRLVPVPGFSQPTAQSTAMPMGARFQPYLNRSPSAETPGCAPASRLPPGAGGVLPLLTPLGHPGRRSSGSHSDAFLAALQQQQQQAYVRMHDTGMLPQLLLHVQQQQQQGMHEQVPAREGAAAALWTEWALGEEAAVLAGTTSGGGGLCSNGPGGDGGCGGVMSRGSSGPPVRFPVKGAATQKSAPASLAAQLRQPHELDQLPPLSAPPPAAAATAIAAAAAVAVPSPLPFQHQPVLQLQHLLQQQQHLQQQQQVGPQRTLLASISRTWAVGCEEIWAAAFGEPAPQGLPPPPAPPPSQADSGPMAGWSGVPAVGCTTMLASPPDPGLQ